VAYAMIAIEKNSSIIMAKEFIKWFYLKGWSFKE